MSVERQDGAGKSSGVPVLKEARQAKGYSVLVTREPGGSPVGEHIRELVLHHDISLKTELLLFATAQAEHVERVIYPASERGEIVLCDRLSDSTYAYQGRSRGAVDDVLAMESFHQLSRVQ
ncbi:dTMP kinase [Paraburkholderia tropica]|uniref:dTMP kinase n=1 Tax=Paraburkholderia tropica TaxID=92647 RepID=UPI00399D4773